MSRAVKTRQEWRCPSCGRKYRIPVNAKAPSRCPDCADEEKSLAEQEAGVVKKELSLSNAPDDPPVVTTTFFEPEETEEPKEAQKKSWRKKAKSNPLVAALLDEGEEGESAGNLSREDIDDALEYLRNISKTMTILRRFMGMFIVTMIVSLLSVIFFVMQMKSYFGGLPNQLMQQVQPGNANANPNVNGNGNGQPNRNPGGVDPKKTANDIQEIFKILNELQDGKL